MASEETTTVHPKRGKTNIEQEFQQFMHIETIRINTIGTSPTSWSTTLIINNLEFVFKLDTGADANILPIMYFNKLKLPHSVIKPQKITLKSYTGDKINILGACWLDCIINNNKHKIQFFVSQSKAQALLGLTTCINLNLIKRVETVIKDISSPSEIFNKFSDLFNGIGCIKHSYHMVLKENAQPVVSPIRRVPLPLIYKLKESIDDLVNK